MPTEKLWVQLMIISLVLNLKKGKTTFEEKAPESSFCFVFHYGITLSSSFFSSDLYLVPVPTHYDEFSKRTDSDSETNPITSILETFPHKPIIIASTIYPGTSERFVRLFIDYCDIIQTKHNKGEMIDFYAQNKFIGKEY